LAQVARAVNVKPPRQPALARISDARPRSRGAKAPELFRKSFAPEGVGNAGRTMHPQPRVQKIESTRASSPQVHRNHPAFPHAMVLTAYFVISPVIGLSCHRHQRNTFR